MKLEANESGLDRMVRAVLGLIVFYLGIAGVVQGAVGIVLIVVGVVLLLTAATGFCPLYKLIKIHTN